MTSLRLALSLPFLLCPLAPWADDGWLGGGGALHLMKGGHPHVRMVNEHITISVSKETTKVHCVFHFRNDGAATTLMMGFPDEDDHRGEEGDKPTTVFSSFKSWVDGKRVRTKFEEGTDGDYWDVKAVTFKAQQTIEVVDDYTMTTAAGDETGRDYFYYLSYRLSTGASWKGNIGHVIVDVKFVGLPEIKKFSPLHFLDEAVRRTGGPSQATRLMLKKKVHTLFWEGFARPRLVGNMVRFEGWDLKPKESDDILLKFAPHGSAN